MIEIKRLEEIQIPKFVEVHLECWKETYSNLMKESVYKSREKKQVERISHIKKRIDHPEYHYYAVWDDFQMVGILIFTTILKSGLLDAIYLKKEYQNKKIGTRLFNFVKQEMKLLDIENFSVFILQNNPANEVFKHWNALYHQTELITIHGVDYKEFEYVVEVGKL